MAQSLVNCRYWIFLAVPTLLVALSSCGSSSTDTVDSETTSTAEEAESAAVDQEGSDQESVEPEATESGDNEPSSTDGATATAFNQPNILLVISNAELVGANAF